MGCRRQISMYILCVYRKFVLAVTESHTAVGGCRKAKVPADSDLISQRGRPASNPPTLSCCLAEHHHQLEFKNASRQRWKVWFSQVEASIGSPVCLLLPRITSLRSLRPGF